jgi:plastocyanin
VIWFRAALVVAIAAVIVIALAQTGAAPPTTAPTLPTTPSAPAPLPTRAPLPTLAPEVITSIISRETPQTAATATASAQPQVQAVDYAFVPAQLSLPRGSTVTWTNGGSDGHDVTGSGPGGDWRSGPLAPGDRYWRSFDLPGTFDYVCSIHPEMRGQIVIRP